MKPLIVLDTGLLGMAVHPKARPDFQGWLARHLSSGARICIPEIADYELRRELIREGLFRSVQRLDDLEGSLDFIPISTAMMRRAAQLWAKARNEGHVTAPKEALDGDVILAAQSLVFAELSGGSLTVATDNVRHLVFFVDAKRWDEIITP